MPTYTQSIRLPKGTNWSAAITADPGYNPGTLQKKNGVMTSDDVISATEATLKTLNIQIIQSEHQQIQVTCNDTVNIVDFTCLYNTPYTAIVQPDMFYAPGTLNIPTSGNFTEDTIISATPVTIQKEYIMFNFIPVEMHRTDTGATAAEDNSYGMCVGWVGGENKDDPGEVHPEYVQGNLDRYNGYLIFDLIMVRKNTNEGIVAFYGNTSVKELFTYFSMTITNPATEDTIEVCKDFPSSLFNDYGDIDGRPGDTVFAIHAEEVNKIVDWASVRDFLVRNLNQSLTIYLNIT